MTRPTRDEWGLRLAEVTASRATCLRRSVGCALVDKRGHILATGYNGVAAGQKHCNEPQPESVLEYLKEIGREYIPFPYACPGAQSPSGTNLDGCHAIHAEQNALLQCEKVWEIETCYTTTAPCMTCVKLLLNTSCQRIVFREEYPHFEAARALWTNAGRFWLQLYQGDEMSVKPKGVRTVVYLQEDEVLVKIKRDANYRLGYPLEDIVFGQVITDAVPVVWDQCVQNWLE